MQDLSTNCYPCRLDWRPSRCGAAFEALLMLAAVAAFGSSRWMEAVPVILLAASWLLSLVLIARHMLRRQRIPSLMLELLPGRRLRWRDSDGVLRESAGNLHEQWPVAVLDFGIDGSTRVFWPDTLCDSRRRALRRWADATPDASPLTQFWMG